MPEAKTPPEENAPKKDKEDEVKYEAENPIEEKKDSMRIPSLSKKIALAPNQKHLNPQEEFQMLIKNALDDLNKNKSSLEDEINELSIRKSQLELELSKNFTGQSDDIARHVKGFQEYLTGALRELAQSAEKLDLVVEPLVLQRSPLDAKESSNIENESTKEINAIADTFKPDEDLIRNCLKEFLGQSDFYAEPWKLRRSIGKKDIEILEDWFFNMGGRGAQPSRGNRAKNILLTAALISILGELYGERFQTLVLASQPERLGEWRRGLQEALGLSREDFGPNSGIVLFERGDGLIERADRLEEIGELPLIIVDGSEIDIEIPILQFPLWLVFAGSQDEIYEDQERLGL